jgi:hypothetical protein
MENRMSIRHLPYPPDFDIDHAAAHHEERRRRALKSLAVGDVLAQVDDLIASEPDPTKHPCFPVANWLLDRQGRVDGGAFWLQWQVLVDQAIERLIEQRLQGED